MTGKLQRKNKLVYSVGINDANYEIQPKIDGKLVRCPYYVVWKNMLSRCYRDEYQERNPTYKGCHVYPEWIYFMNFRRWMQKQDWEGKELDKDLLIRGNKIYSPTTCVFVDAIINSFTLDCGRSRGEYPIGTYFNKEQRKFRSRCRNPFTKKLEHLGYFTCPNQAHLAWKKRKHELACQLADLQTDPRVAEALRTRYL